MTSRAIRAIEIHSETWSMSSAEREVWLRKRKSMHCRALVEAHYHKLGREHIDQIEKDIWKDGFMPPHFHPSPDSIVKDIIDYANQTRYCYDKRILTPADDKVRELVREFYKECLNFNIAKVGRKPWRGCAVYHDDFQRWTRKFTDLEL